MRVASLFAALALAAVPFVAAQDEGDDVYKLLCWLNLEGAASLVFWTLRRGPLFSGTFFACELGQRHFALFQFVLLTRCSLKLLRVWLGN